MSNDVVRWTKKLCESIQYEEKARRTSEATTTLSVATTTKASDKASEEKRKCENNLKIYQYDDGDELCQGRRIFLYNSNFISKSTCNRLVFLYIIINMFNLIVSVYCDDLLSSPGARGHFTPTWAVHIPGGDDSANNVATEHGFINLGKIFDDHYHFQHNSVSKRSINPSHHHQNRLENDDRVRWSKQQRAKSRPKRDLIKIRNTRPWNSILLNDPKWPLMWYLNRGSGLDMNVIPAWKEGITGKGVVVTILDDGLESSHPDLEANYDPKASYDVNSHDDDPMPHYDMTDSNRHGTRCAGEVAATANNSQCAVGIAFGARVGGVRMLDGDVTDAVEARSLSLNPQHIDIYSASWGPDDDGKTVDGPGELATRAFVEGINSGRNGKGSIFIWASGNGGREHDNCNCDGYTNSIWTLSISSATEEGSVPWYSEMCSSTLATTYSSGSPGEKQVVTTDLHHSCTSSHTGTSASAPLAAGIAALVLEANRNLTWRDLQHIVVRTAKPGNLKDPTWAWNGVARKVSHSFGYGLMDAAAMVKLARNWKQVPEQHRCEINAPHIEQISPKSHITLQLTVKHCKGVNYLEHVQAKITLQSQRRGDIQIYLTSPAGTRVTLLTSRSHDVSRSGFNQWPFMSVHTWGEAPHGDWQLEIHNEGRYMAQIQQWDMIMYGTEVSAQPDDLPPPKIPTIPNSASTNEMEHNSLEVDTGTASGQWRNTQQVGESHVDVQRTTSSDLTSSACVTYSSGHKCIECQHNTYLYNGQCLSSCPDGTYLVPEKPINKTKYKQQTDNAVSLSLRSSSTNNTTKTDNKEDFSTLDDLLPTQTHHQHPRAIPQKYCAACHEACFQCSGPADTDCKSCNPNYSKSTISPGVVACIPSINSSRHQHKFYDEKTIKISWKNLTIYEIIVIGIFLTFAFLLVSLAVYFVLKKFSCVCLWLCSHRKNDNVKYQYDRIEMDDKGLNDEELSLKKGLVSKTGKGQLKLMENENLSSEESTDDLD